MTDTIISDTRPPTSVAGAEIHPEIPLAPWVTDRYEDDDVSLVRSVIHAWDDSGNLYDHPETLTVSWINQFPDVPSPECANLLVSDIGKLASVLQRFQAEVGA